MKRFIEVTLKLHQVFALVDTKFEQVFPTDSVSTRDKNLPNHLKEVLTEMQR